MTSTDVFLGIPDMCQTQRPYAFEKMIYKSVDVAGRSATFIIDPWTQHWIIGDRSVVELLKLANGRRTLSSIIEMLSERSDLPRDPDSYIEIANSLMSAEILFSNKAEHEQRGRPVYNKSEVTGIHLEITNACNMTCTHCYVSSGKKLPGELTLAQIYKTIDMLPPFSGKRIAISGGEPVVRKDLLSIVEYAARDCGHAVDLYTNGWKFPDKVAQRLSELNRELGGVIRLQLSLEGADSETNDAVRGKGSFDQALKSLEVFRRNELNRSVTIFVCITKHNIGHIDSLIELAEKFDVSMLVFSQWQRQGNAADTPWATIAPGLDEWVGAGERLLKYHNPRLAVFGNFYGDLNNNEYGRFSLDRPLFPKHVYMYNSFPRISPNGDVWADQLWVDPNWVLGNVTRDDLTECFETPRFYEQLAQMRSRTENVPECRQCEWRDLCEGGSAGHTYAEFGHMNEKDLFCDSRMYWFNRFVEHQVQLVGDAVRGTR
ncbi:radical SAM protein [Nocardia gipuzkoensis]